MNEPLSVYELIANASALVQGVMGLLVLASVVSWMMIFQRWSVLRRAKQEIDQFEDHFWSGIDLRGLYQELSEEEHLNGIEGIFVAGFREFNRLSEQPGVDAEAIMQGRSAGHACGPAARRGAFRNPPAFSSHSRFYQPLRRVCLVPSGAS
jgi:biopolymer transport protein TolQ